MLQEYLLTHTRLRPSRDEVEIEHEAAQGVDPSYDRYRKMTLKSVWSILLLKSEVRTLGMCYQMHPEYCTCHQLS